MLLKKSWHFFDQLTGTIQRHVFDSALRTACLNASFPVHPAIYSILREVKKRIVQNAKLSNLTWTKQYLYFFIP